MGGYQYFFSIATLFTEEVAAASFWHSPSSLSFFCSGQFLLFLTEFLKIKLLTTIGHWVTQLNPHKLTCSCSAENLMYNYKKRDQLAQAFSWIRPPKNTKATKQRQHQKSSSFTVEFLGHINQLHPDEIFPSFRVVSWCYFLAPFRVYIYFSNRSNIIYGKWEME